MSRRRFFTVDEALAELLAEEDDDFFFGEDPELIRRQRAGEDSDSSSPEVDDVDAVDPETNNDGDASDDDSSALHHLEQEVDTSAAARKFLAGDSSSARRVTDLSGEASARPLETRHQCGCSKDCLKAGPPPPLEAILVIFGRRALIFFLFESSWKKMKNDATLMRMRSGDQLGDAKMSKKGTLLRRI